MEHPDSLATSHSLYTLHLKQNHYFLAESFDVGLDKFYKSHKTETTHYILVVI